MDCREKIYSEEYADGIIDFDVAEYITQEIDACAVSMGNGFTLVYQNRSIAPDIPGSGYEYRYIPNLYGLMQIDAGTAGMERFDPAALVQIGSLSLLAEPLALTGRGTVIAFIDTGINFNDDVFKDEFGQTRILAMWDQNDGGSAPPPDGFYYGSEYTRSRIQEAIDSERPYEAIPARDSGLHGSILAAVAAGSKLGGGEEYNSPAPESDILVVKLKEAKEYLKSYYQVPQTVSCYEESDIMAGVAYAMRYAESFQRPLIICLGVGTNMGAHTADGMLARYLEQVARIPGVCVVSAAGNEGSAQHHYQGNLPVGVEDAYEDVEVLVEDGISGFSMEMWGLLPDTYTVGVRTPGGEVVPPFRIVRESTREYRFVFERTILVIQQVLVEISAGQQFVRFILQNPTAGVWSFRIQGVGNVYDGRFHIWLPIQEFLPRDVRFLRPDPRVTVTCPANGEGVISVAAYGGETGGLWAPSGKGYTPEGHIVPSVSAPGVDVFTPYGRRTGTSIAAALVSGGLAQYLQWAIVEDNDLLAGGIGVRSFLEKGAIRDAQLRYPNPNWGYGKANIRGMLEVMQDTGGM